MDSQNVDAEVVKQSGISLLLADAALLSSCRLLNSSNHGSTL